MRPANVRSCSPPTSTEPSTAAHADHRHSPRDLRRLQRGVRRPARNAASLADLRPHQAPRRPRHEAPLAISPRRPRRTPLVRRVQPQAGGTPSAPCSLQASAGFAGTVLLVGGSLFLLGMVAAPRPSWPTMSRSAPSPRPAILYSAVSARPILTDRNNTTIVVDASVNSLGQRLRLQFVSGARRPRRPEPGRRAAPPHVFEPARIFGAPSAAAPSSPSPASPSAAKPRSKPRSFEIPTGARLLAPMDGRPRTRRESSR